MKEEIMIYYKTLYGCIKECEVVRETDEFVYLPNGRRENKDSQKYGTFIRKTREEAKAALVSYHMARCEDAKDRYRHEQEDLERVMGL